MKPVQQFKRCIGKALLLLSLGIAFPYLSNAQFEEGDPGFLPDDPDGNSQAPLDGGLAILIAAAIGYTSRRMHDEALQKQHMHLSQPLRSV